METKKIKNKTLIATIEKLHENEKLAKDLCCGLPLDIDQAKRIVATLKGDTLSLAAISSWLEALQESLDETIVRVAYIESSNAASPNLVKTVIETSHDTLQSKMKAILQTLKAGKEPGTVLKERHGAVATDLHTPHQETHANPAVQARTLQGATAKALERKSSGYTEWQP